MSSPGYTYSKSSHCHIVMLTNPVLLKTAMANRTSHGQFLKENMFFRGVLVVNTTNVLDISISVKFLLSNVLNFKILILVHLPQKCSTV